MKRISNNIFLMAALALLAASCDKDGDMLTVVGTEDVTLSGNGGDIVLNYNQVDDLALTVYWSDNGEISLSESGTYSIRIRNFVNQQHMFNVQYPSFTLTILYEVIYLINNETPIQNAVYNNNVTLNLHDVSFYTMTTFSASVYLNNVLQKVKTDYTYTNNIFYNKTNNYKFILC